MLKNPFFTRSDHDCLSVHLRLHTLLLIWPISTIVLLFLVITFSCFFTFPCSEFLPTISYLAGYSYYDRFIIVIVSAQIFPLLPFFLGTFLIYSQFLDKIDSYVLLFLSFCAALLLPTIVVIDEVNSSYYFPFDKIHAIVLASILLAFMLWMLFSLEWLIKSYQEKPRKEVLYATAYIFLCFGSAGISWKSWKNAERVEDYFWLAISEYWCIIIWAFLPWVYCLAFKEISISINRIKSF